MTDFSHALSEPGSHLPVLPKPDKAITNGWRRETPGGARVNGFFAYENPPQIGDTTYPEGILTGEEL